MSPRDHHTDLYIRFCFYFFHRFPSLISFVFCFFQQYYFSSLSSSLSSSSFRHISSLVLYEMLSRCSFTCCTVRTSAMLLDIVNRPTSFLPVFLLSLYSFFLPVCLSYLIPSFLSFLFHNKAIFFHFLSYGLVDRS